MPIEVCNVFDRSKMLEDYVQFLDELYAERNAQLPAKELVAVELN